MLRGDTGALRSRSLGARRPCRETPAKRRGASPGIEKAAVPGNQSRAWRLGAVDSPAINPGAVHRRLVAGESMEHAEKAGIGTGSVADLTGTFRFGIEEEYFL